ncbi:MAG: T9SS type A sorting domain-containing protein [Saprospirales bacterium]|nr:T9SS type A sorting domain-containing protein [Saprospirales bacterium]
MKNPYLAALLGLLCYPLWSQSSNADCSHAAFLCNKQAVVVETLEDAGADLHEVGPTGCLKEPFPESNSAWFKWTVRESGTLDFTILPLDEQDDIDFVVYRLPGSSDNCLEKEELRCMLAGRILGEEKAKDLPCTGATGLRAGAGKFAEGKGCADGAGNYLASLDVHAGVSYALFVNNFHSARGFLLEFFGSCTFQESAGPCGVTSDAPVLHNFGDIAVSPVRPNPATDEARISLRSAGAFTGSMLLVDVQGRIMEQRPVSILPGENEFVLKVAHLSTGVYFIKMRIGDHAYLSRFYKG